VDGRREHRGLDGHVGAVPNGKFILYVKNRVLIAGVPGTPHRLYASALGDPRNWGTAANQGWAVDLDPNDGDAITGIGVVGPYVMVFKNEKAFTVYDLDTGANRRLSHERRVRRAPLASPSRRRACSS
jgi:hypothetical protein